MMRSASYSVPTSAPNRRLATRQIRASAHHSDGTLTYSEAVEQIKAAYQNAKLAAQNGNWADYGRYLEQLEQAISQLEANPSSSAASAESAEAFDNDQVQEDDTEDSADQFQDDITV